MMLENAKRKMATAMKTGPMEPISELRAAWVRAMPFSSGVWYKPLMRMTNAVHEQTNSVSVKTPNACISPYFTGWETVAVAATLGALPSPASLLKSPRFTPFMMVAPNAPPTDCSKPKALVTMTFIT